ncbi:hypothetical protein DFJ73DRAFT_950675 [Zopfochytrium polystomum]|nr:hypothetical protein DFJ73DRAFT_950675 [Zopfochytrium polystomum]
MSTTARHASCEGGAAAAASSAAPSSRTRNRSRRHQNRQGQANRPRAATTIALAVKLLLIVLALAVVHHASAAGTSNAKNKAPASEMPSERPKARPVAAAGGAAAFNAKQKDKTATSEVRAERPKGRPGGGGVRLKTVGGVTVKVGEKIKAQVNTRADVEKASTDGKTYNAVYKKYRLGESVGPHEVDATRKAGQLIAAQGKRMIQHKVGEMGLNEYLKQASKDPAAKKAYQKVDDNLVKRLGKPKLSDHINKQIVNQQKQVGYAHLDVHPDNIRITPQEQLPGKRSLTAPFRISQYKGAKAELIDWGNAHKLDDKHIDVKNEQRFEKKEIVKACEKHGFRFRTGGAVGQVYRRALGSCTPGAGPGK